MKRFEHLHSEADRRKVERDYEYRYTFWFWSWFAVALLIWCCIDAFAQQGQVIRRELQTDKDGNTTGIFLAFSLKGLPDFPGQTGYREYMISGEEFAALPATEPARETMILAIIRLQIEKGLLSWEKELQERPKPPISGQPADQLRNPDGTRKVGTIVLVDLAAVRASTTVTTSTAATTTTRATTTTTTLTSEAWDPPIILPYGVPFLVNDKKGKRGN